jgi:hypothetical protein
VLAYSVISGDYVKSNTLIEDCLLHVRTVEDRIDLLRIRSRNHWSCNHYSLAAEDIMGAVRLLGVEVANNPTRKIADSLFDKVIYKIISFSNPSLKLVNRSRGKFLELDSITF